MNVIEINNHAALFLAMIGVSLAIAEMFIMSFALLPIGLAFIITSIGAIWIHDWLILFGILALTEIFLFLYFKYALKKFHGKARVYTNMEGMVGRECEVVDTVSPQKSGYVKLYGDLWQAKTHNRQVLTSGSKVLISKIDGNKVWVEPITGLEE